MFPTPFGVVVDANALFPFTLRDTLLRAAEAGLFQLRWSVEILDETQRSLIETRQMLPETAARLRTQMERAFPESLVTDYEGLSAAMRNDPGDRHVAAAAVKCGAQVIVTSNLKHFTDLPDGLEAQSPDTFLCNLFDLEPQVMVRLLRQQAGDLVNPPMTLHELLHRLARVAPDFVELVQDHLGDP
jgi:predicted nucleic acid-binding protein